MTDKPEYIEMEVFSAKVKEAIKIPGMIRHLAEEMAVAESTVKRWASGIAKPHPHLRFHVVDAIDKYNELSAERNPDSQAWVPHEEFLAMKAEVKIWKDKYDQATGYIADLANNPLSYDVLEKRLSLAVSALEWIGNIDNWLPTQPEVALKKARETLEAIKDSR